MIIRLLLFILLIFLNTAVRAEYYLAYQQPTTPINLDFSTKTKHHSHATTHHRIRNINDRVIASDKNVICGCAPNDCYVPKRDIYTAAPTSCVTYDAVLSGYR